MGEGLCATVRSTYLFETDDVRMPQRPVVDDFSLHILIDLQQRETTSQSSFKTPVDVRDGYGRGGSDTLPCLPARCTSQRQALCSSYPASTEPPQNFPTQCLGRVRISPWSKGTPVPPDLCLTVRLGVFPGGQTVSDVLLGHPFLPYSPS